MTEIKLYTISVDEVKLEDGQRVLENVWQAAGPLAMLVEVEKHQRHFYENAPLMDSTSGENVRLEYAISVRLHDPLRDQCDVYEWDGEIRNAYVARDGGWTLLEDFEDNL